MDLFTGVSLYTFIRYVEESMGTLCRGMKTWTNENKSHKTDENWRSSRIHVIDLEAGQ